MKVHPYRSGWRNAQHGLESCRDYKTARPCSHAASAFVFALRRKGWVKVLFSSITASFPRVQCGD